MATEITTRAAKGAPLTYLELDENFVNLRDTADAAFDATVALGGKANASALGVSTSATNMDTFTGATIPDNQTAKQALQALETSTELRLLTADAASTANDKGASLVGYRTNYTVRQKLSETVSIKDFGAIGDGTLHTVAEWIFPGALGRYASLVALQVDYPHVTSATDSIDWAGGQAAFNAAVTHAFDILVPAGDYIMHPLVLSSTSESYMPSITGSGRGSTIFRKRPGSGTGPLLEIGGPSAIMQVRQTIRGITLDGTSIAASSHCIRSYSLVRASLVDVRMQNADTVFGSYGGVSWRIHNCEILNGNFGVYCDKYAGSTNALYPNNILIDGKTIISNCATRGIYFDHGRFLKVSDIEMDTCGTVGDNNTSGILIGTNIDSEDGGVNPCGAVIVDSWFEQIAGVAVVVQRSGRSIYQRNNLGPNPNSLFDFRNEGGTYDIDDWWWTGTIKAPAILDAGGAGSGSSISRCRQLAVSNLSIDNTKTDVDFVGRVYTVASLPSPAGGLARAWASDSTVGTVGNFGALLTGGGGTLVPVFFDGTNWRIG